MGFEVHVNTILRQETIPKLEVGGEYQFEKDGLHVLADTMPIWLALRDWTAVAEIQVTSQERRDGRTVGKYRVKHLYKGEEQDVMTSAFRRMYGWD